MSERKRQNAGGESPTGDAGAGEKRAVSEKCPVRFHTSPSHTVGVELELQILDGASAAFRNLAPEVLSNVPAKLDGRVKEEFITSMIEVTSGRCHSVDEVDTNLREALAFVENELAPQDAVLYASSLHPFEIGDGKNVSTGERYQRLLQELQFVGRRFIAQGLHVHVGAESGDSAVKVTNGIRGYLPLLLALSTSSPFHAGEDTGVLSYRTVLFEALPRSGLPDRLDGWAGFLRLLDALRTSGAIRSFSDIWWDVRPHPTCGTVEVRVCDLPYRMRDIVALCAMVQALVATLAELPEDGRDGPERMLMFRANKWQAIRFGLDGAFIDPATGTRGSIRDAIERLLALVAPKAAELGTERHLAAIRGILEEGTGAHRQLELYRNDPDFEKMIHAMREVFYQ